MPNINSLTYNGMKSTDLGVYVTGSGSFDAAEMDADKYEIAGRNGDLIIPKNRYKNIVVTYPAFIPKAFQEKAQSIRNWMRSAKAYARLEDTYDMEHYRLGLASGIQSFEPVNRNDASNFQLSFDCKPQRFLKTGETPLPIEPEAHSYSGEIVSFETVAVDDMTKAEVSLSPIQSLNGYDHPWAGGAGKNKYPNSDISGTAEGVTVTHNADESYKVSGLPTAYRGFVASDTFTLKAGTYTLSRTASSSAVSENNLRMEIRSVNGTTTYATSSANGGVFTLAEDTEVKARIVVGGANVDFGTGITYRFQIESGSSPTAWTPYENICPITGHDSATLNIGAEYPTPDDSYPVTFPQTVYGGTFDWVSGKLVVKWAEKDLGDLSWSMYGSGDTAFFYSTSSTGIVPSTNDAICSLYTFGSVTTINTINCVFTVTGNPYIRIRDTSYQDAATFKTAMRGVQFVYPLATPIEIDLTPAQVQTLLGLNNVWASDGTVEINYADPFNVDNPTYFEARPLFEITNPAQNDVLNVNGKTITFLSSYTGTVTIDCETMDCFSGNTNLNYLISATDFLVLNEGVNIVTWSGSGTCKMTPRWWEL